MAYKYDSKNTGSEMIPEGAYECLISGAHTTESKFSGTPYIALSLVVRNDVEQECKNRIIRDSLYLSEKARPYSEKKMNTIMKCNDFPDGVEFDTDDAWCAAIIGLPLIVNVKHKLNDYSGEMEAKVSFYKRTEHPDVSPAWKDGKAPARMDAQSGAMVVTDEELPF